MRSRSRNSSATTRTCFYCRCIRFAFQDTLIRMYLCKFLNTHPRLQRYLYRSGEGIFLCWTKETLWGGRAWMWDTPHPLPRQADDMRASYNGMNEGECRVTTDVCLNPYTSNIHLYTYTYMYIYITVLYNASWELKNLQF